MTLYALERFVCARMVHPVKYMCRTCLQNLRKTRWKFISRSIFSQTGIWDEELTRETKIQIERYWHDKLNVSHQYSTQSEKSKYYVLSMFPYPSGKLHMGHVRIYVTGDAIARFHRMTGKHVIHPMGWDSFGLPAENAAIEHGERPDEWTNENIAHMKAQLQELGCSFDWNRELSTCSPDYYKWTQFIFLKMFERGLAYQKEALVNWDPVDKTVLANEQVDENGCSWRSGAQVEKIYLKQWFLRTTDFSQDLYNGLSDPSLGDWRDITSMQEHWIGNCNGCKFTFGLECNGKQLDDNIVVWTQYPEFIYGGSFIGVSSSHVLNKDVHYSSDPCDGQVKKLILHAIHPFTEEKLSIFISDAFNFPEGSDSLIGFPGENASDAEFANKHMLKYIKVTSQQTSDVTYLINSDKFSGLEVSKARDAICSYAKKIGVGGYFTSSKLRDWLISRQRYWGTPIPIIHCDTCNVVPVPYKDLPITLPEAKHDNEIGLSLKEMSNWVCVTCPRCGGKAKRETDTMDTFVDSSWYYLRFLDSENRDEPFNTEIVNHFMPVDIYVGGKEHAVLHLYFARFVNHFLHSVGLVSHKEPFKRLLVQGVVMGQTYRLKESGRCLRREELDFSGNVPVERSTGKQVVVDWEKMSKSKHNGIDPQGVIKENGVDTTRLFILGDVAPTSNRHWSTETFPGILNWQWKMWLTVKQFLDVRNGKIAATKISEQEYRKHENTLFERRNHFVKKATHHFARTFQLSVALTNLQGLTKIIRGIPEIVVDDSPEFENALAAAIIMSTPFAPCFASELWAGFTSVPSKKSNLIQWDKCVSEQPWPDVDMHYKLALIVKINHETVKIFKYPREQLDKLTLQDALIVLETDPDLKNYMHKSRCEPSLEIIPGYDARINFNIPGLKIKKSKTDRQ